MAVEELLRPLSATTTGWRQAVTNLIRAPLLVLLSDVDGLFDGDPASRHRRSLPQSWTSTIRSCGSRARGVIAGERGHAQQAQAARIATAAGENVIIANGHQPGILARILAGEPVGTLLVAQGQTVSSRKRWIGFTVQTRGRLLLDEGAIRAIKSQGRSLLPIGVVSSEGDFQKGDVVSICDGSGARIRSRTDELQFGRDQPHPGSQQQSARRHPVPEPLRRSRPPRQPGVDELRRGQFAMTNDDLDAQTLCRSLRCPAFAEREHRHCQLQSTTRDQDIRGHTRQKDRLEIRWPHR